MGKYVHLAFQAKFSFTKAPALPALNPYLLSWTHLSGRHQAVQNLTTHWDKVRHIMLCLAVYTTKFEDRRHRYLENYFFVLPTRQ